jgi:hypothetical protein
MKIVVLDGYALNPGDLSWTALEALGHLEIPERTGLDAILDRSRDAEIDPRGRGSGHRRVGALDRRRLLR